VLYAAAGSLYEALVDRDEWLREVER
jgi:hypothetical protein